MSVLPGMYFEISAHLLPCILCVSMKMNSSFLFHGLFLTLGSKWLCHLSRHYFPFLVEEGHLVCSSSEMIFHLLVPYFSTRTQIKRSSSFYQCCLSSRPLLLFWLLNILLFVLKIKTDFINFKKIISNSILFY